MGVKRVYICGTRRNTILHTISHITYTFNHCTHLHNNPPYIQHTKQYTINKTVYNFTLIYTTNTLVYTITTLYTIIYIVYTNKHYIQQLSFRLYGSINLKGAFKILKNGSPKNDFKAYE